MKKLLYILFCITLISCNSKTEEIKEEVVVFSSDGTTIYENDVYEVINAFLSNFDEHQENPKKLAKGDFLLLFPFVEEQPYEYDIQELNEILSRSDSLFSEKDKKFITKQMKNSNFDLKQGFISNYKVLSKDFINTITGFSDEVNKFHTISIPLFNLKKDIAMISFGTYTGYNDASGMKIIYKKENGKWVAIKTLNLWIS